MENLFFRHESKIYSLPMKVVAEHRATHYEEKGSPEWDDEVHFAMNDLGELHDWLFNNTNPEDFLEHFVLVRTIEPDELSTTTSWDELSLLDDDEVN